MSEQMRLRWTSHQGTILSVLDALLSSESLVDVTLACDGQYIRAHKLILSACSPYFQELLNVDSNKHPIFFLNNVKFTELQALVQYMYRGEVNIAREDLPSLLQVAQALKIRGLADMETTTNQTSSDMLILPDLGSVNRQNPATLPPPQAAPIPMSLTPNAHFPRNFQQIHSFAPPNVNSTFGSPIIAAAPVAPPPAKKTRTETPTRPSAQTDQVQNQFHLQLGDPRILVHRLSSAQIDPLQSEPSTSRHFQETENENQDIKEKEEFYDEVKVEDPEHIDVDLTEEYDGENSMSQSGFSESWQLGEGDDTSGMAGDDCEVPGGSCGDNANESGTGGGADGGKGSLLINGRSSSVPSAPIFDGNFFKILSWTRVIHGRTTGKKVLANCNSCGSMLKGVSSNDFQKHLKRVHPDVYSKFLAVYGNGTRIRRKGSGRV